MLMFTQLIRKISIKATLLITVASLFVFPFASADELTNRSVTITSSRPGEVSDQLFDFEFISANNVGSIAFEYCSNSAALEATCVAPAGLNVSGVNLAFQSGETGFGVHGNTTTNRIVISRPASVVTPGAVQYLFGGAINQSGVNQTAYVRIFAYSSSDGTGPYVDASSVAYSTAVSIDTQAFVPPHLIFCVGISVALDCSSATGNFIQLGELQPNTTALATSQYSGATNDPTGYTVSIVGTTMTSGNNVIPALASPTNPSTGQSQFGINLRNNNNPDVGIDPIGPGSATASGKYGQLNSFVFESGDIISSTDSTTEYDRFTVSYIVNVSDAQPPGVYNATFTYVATASF